MNNKQIRQILKEEILLFNLGQKILSENKKLVSERKDFHSLVVREILHKKYGANIDIYQIDEGVWDKLKNIVAKGGNKLAKAFNIGKRGWEKEVDRQEMEDIVANAGDALTNAFVKDLTKSDPDGNTFPNQEDSAMFANRLQAIQFAYGTILAALKEGKIPHESAVAAITALKKFLENSLGKMSTVYKTFNEEEEGDDEVINEKITKGLAKLVADLANQTDTLAGDPAGDVEIPAKIAKKLANIARRAAKEGDKDVLNLISNGVDDKFGTEIVKRAWEEAGRRVMDAAGGAATAAAGGAGATKVAGGAAATVGKVTTSAKTAMPIASVVKTTPSLGGLLATLGISPAAAVAGAGALLVGGLFLKGKISSRAASIKNLIKMMKIPESTPETDVVPDTDSPEPDAPAEPAAAEPATTEPEPAAAGTDEPLKLFNDKDEDFLAARISQSLNSMGVKPSAQLRGAIKNIIKDIAKQLQINKIQVTEAEIADTDLIVERDTINRFSQAYKLMQKYGFGTTARKHKTLENFLTRLEKNRVIPPKPPGVDQKEYNEKSMLNAVKKILAYYKIESPEQAKEFRQKLGATMSKSGAFEKMLQDAGVSKTRGGGYVAGQSGQIDVGRAIGGKLMRVLPKDLDQKQRQKIITQIIKLAKGFISKGLKARNIENIKIRESLLSESEIKRWQIIAGINKKVL